MAHRMHACIAAYAYAKPHVGFAWDEKLRSFFNAVGRDEFVADAGRIPVCDLMGLADRALAEGVAPGPHAACVGRARTEIARLVASFGPARVTRAAMVAAQ